VTLREESERLRGEAAARTHELLDFIRRRAGGVPREELALHLPRLRASAGVARASVERWLVGRGVPAADVVDVVLATSEACANAIEHPRSTRRPAFLVSGACRNRSIEIAVQDFGLWSDRASDASRGRGLALIRSLMDEVAVDETEEGTRLRMRRRYSGTST
jgi:anti-sigma regulatory factor (Ser/Thr protein kinase)